MSRAMCKGKKEPSAAKSTHPLSPLRVYLIGLDSFAAFDYISKGPEEDIPTAEG